MANVRAGLKFGRQFTDREHIMRSTMAVMTAATLALATTVRAEVETEGFENGVFSLVRWSWGPPPGPQSLVSGGNPGNYLRQGGLTSILPRGSTVDPSEFTGNYRANEVLAVGIDLIAVSSGVPAVPLTVTLVTTNGTPTTSDDWGAYFVGPDDVPTTVGVWQSYSFNIPSLDTTLPAGWTFFAGVGAPTPNWMTLMQNVDRLTFQYGAPGTAWVGGNVTYGMDNAWIEFAEPAVPAVSQWSAAAMALLLLIGGTLVAARTSSAGT
jgi:hypothetical protein